MRQERREKDRERRGRERERQKKRERNGIWGRQINRQRVLKGKMRQK